MDSRKKEIVPNFFKKFFGKMKSCERVKVIVPKSSFSTTLSESTSNATNTISDDPDTENTNHDQPNIEMRYGGQCLTVDQLPEFCNQLHQLLEVIRNVQSYSKITGEYPSQLERRLNEEAGELAALYAEVKNAKEIIARTKIQRRAVKAEKKEMIANLTALRDAERRELENIVRASDRKLFRCWESLKDTNVEEEFDTLIEDIRNKQTALESLQRLIDNKKSNLIRQNVPIPPPLPLHINNDHKRSELLHRRLIKRRRKAMKRDAKSIPLTTFDSSLHIPEEPNAHASNRNRLGSINIITLSPDFPPLENNTDVAFFTTL